MLYIGIPAHNEATTIGVLLWRLRSVLSDVSREYEVVVYDDASTDQTAETLAPYTRVLPLTVLRGERRLGYGGAVDAIARHVARTTRYPRRDALLLLQGDFTDPPALVPEFLRRFEGGADLVIGERTSAGDAPVAVQRLWKASRWVLRPFVGITDVRDLTSSFRLVRIAVLRDLIKAAGDAPIAAGRCVVRQRRLPAARRTARPPRRDDPGHAHVFGAYPRDASCRLAGCDRAGEVGLEAVAASASPCASWPGRSSTPKCRRSWPSPSRASARRARRSVNVVNGQNVVRDARARRGALSGTGNGTAVPRATPRERNAAVARAPNGRAVRSGGSPRVRCRMRAGPSARGAEAREAGADEQPGDAATPARRSRRKRGARRERGDGAAAEETRHAAHAAKRRRRTWYGNRGRIVRGGW